MFLTRILGKKCLSVINSMLRNTSSKIRKVFVRSCNPEERANIFYLPRYTIMYESCAND